MLDSIKKLSQYLQLFYQMNDIQTVSQQKQLPLSSEKIEKYPQQIQQLQHITLRELKLRNFQTQNAIQAVQARINYMKNKEQKTLKKVFIVKRKLTSLQNVKSKAKQYKQTFQEEKKKQQQNQVKKSQLNKLIKDHLKYNKKIVVTLMNHKIGEETKSFKEKLSQYQMLTQVQRQNMREQNAQKANRVRIEHIQAQQKRKIYFLDKLTQFKHYKQQKLKEELKQRQRQEMMISQLEQKQRMLLERLSVSEKFRLKCQQQYQEAKKKYHSFYQASKGLTRGVTRGHSVDEEDDQNQRKADIFIS